MTFPFPFANAGVKYADPGSQTWTSAGAQSFVIPRYKNTLTIELWGAGGGGGKNGVNGGAGGASTVASLGLSAGGGGGGINTAANGAGGVASGGTTNINGGAGSGSTAGAAANSGPGVGGSGGYYTYTVTEGPFYHYGSPNRFWETDRESGDSLGTLFVYWQDVPYYVSGVGYYNLTSFSHSGYTFYKGATVSGSGHNTLNYVSRSYSAGAYARAGGGGAYVSKTYSKGALTVGAVLALIIGAAGSSHGSAAGAGRIKITWT